MQMVLRIMCGLPVSVVFTTHVVILLLYLMQTIFCKNIPELHSYPRDIRLGASVCSTCHRLIRWCVLCFLI